MQVRVLTSDNNDDIDMFFTIHHNSNLILSANSNKIRDHHRSLDKMIKEE